MTIKFNINYHTDWGQQLYVVGAHAKLGKWDAAKAQPLVFRGNGHWDLEIKIGKVPSLEYKYFIKHKDGNTEWEFGENRTLAVDGDVRIVDYWRSNQHAENVLYTSPFKNAFFKRKRKSKSATSKSANIRFRIRAPHVTEKQQLCVIGNCKELGNWDEQKPVILNDQDYPVWEKALSLNRGTTDIEYKYALYDTASKSIVGYESGPNRRLIIEPNTHYVITDEYFGHPEGHWKGAGVALPVFSLRSNSSFGVGEFMDLIPLVDWAKKTGLKLIQVLPINDTTAEHTWVDTYPYAAISVFALHPMFLNLKRLGELKNKKEQAKFDQQQAQLNKLEAVDYEAVMDAKSRYFKLTYDEGGQKDLNSKAFKSFFDSNKKWLIPYAAFSYLRDLHGTADFSQWGKHAKITSKALEQLCDPQSAHYHDIAIHYYIQYHLDKQLKEATAYARSNDVVLKGDIPIGIYRYSCDAWIAPHLYNMDGQSGAPPDAFSASGQNWGFPTYNWEEMAKDGYSWWKERFAKIGDYFDAFRIDHILGFFRIWEIPWSAVEGTLGRFNPSLPLGIDELGSWGIDFNHGRLCEPYIRDYTLNEIFGQAANEVRQTYLDQAFPGVYHLKGEYDTQRKVKNHFDGELAKEGADQNHLEYIREGLYRVLKDVILLEAPMSEGKAFNPNIDLASTFSFRDLDGFQQNQLLELHRQYFFHRHNDFWRQQAMEKLPALKEATDMLVCGEDLGMVPDSVPGVMNELQILSLAIQRMPNDNSKEFWHPADTAYLSVCSTSSHDTSTLRQWWEEDRDKTQRFYNSILGNHGEAPFYCEPWIVDQVIAQHLYSPSMWAIFPIQDLLAMDGELRRVFPQDEHINRPEIIPHYWRYRLHMNMEDLVNEEEFNEHLRAMVKSSGRGG